MAKTKPKAKPRKKKATTGRKPGGQPGNKNALRHGFYSKQFTPDESQRLDAQEATDVTAEINILRVCIDRLLNQTYFEPHYAKTKAKDKNGNPILSDQRDEHYLRQLGTLAVMTQSLGGLVRTHHLIKGKGGDVNDAILRALEELRLEMGI